MPSMLQYTNGECDCPHFHRRKGKRIFLQTIYYPLPLFARNSKGQVIDLLVKSAAFESRDFDCFGNTIHLMAESKK
jgi:hypothetical protein